MANLPTFAELKQKRLDDEAYIKTIPAGSTSCIVNSMAIYNQGGPSQNPHECHHFTWATQWDPGDGEIEHVKWVLTGDYPWNLQIDEMSGIITGTIWILNDMPFLKDQYGSEKMHYSGDNWDKTGRPPGTTYTFTFQAHKIHYYSPKQQNDGDSSGSGGESGPPPKVLCRSTGDLTLTTVRSWTVDNLIIARAYLSCETTDVPLKYPVDGLMYKTLNYEYKIGNKAYRIGNFDELLRDHPGPWPDDCDYGIADEEEVRQQLT